MSGVQSQQNTFYGNMKMQPNHPQSRQQNNSLGSKQGTLSSQQSHAQQQSMMSKNDIIAKYVKSMGHNPQILQQQNQIPTTK